MSIRNPQMERSYIKVSGDQTVGTLRSKKERLIYLLSKQGHAKGDARRSVGSWSVCLLDRCQGDTLLPNPPDKLALADVLDHAYLVEAAQRIARRTPRFEAFPATVEFDAMAVDAGRFHVYTNIDFDGANARRKALGGGLEPVIPASWLAALLDARADTALASHYDGEFYTSDETSELVRLRYSELLKRSGIAAEELRSFTEVVLNEYPSIRDVINKRERTFDEFLSILDRSERFREWVQGVHPDAKLVHEYFLEVSADSKLTSLPARLVRYIFTSAVGLAAPVAGLAVAAADSLLLDKIVSGWRPSHFVEGKLKPFLREGGNL